MRMSILSKELSLLTLLNRWVSAGVSLFIDMFIRWFAISKSADEWLTVSDLLYNDWSLCSGLALSDS